MGIHINPKRHFDPDRKLPEKSGFDLLCGKNGSVDTPRPTMRHSFVLVQWRSIMEASLMI